MCRDPDLDLRSGQGHINMQNTCRTTSVPNHLTVAWRTAEIRSFQFHKISTFCEVWTLVIPFLEGNSKIRLQQAVGQVPYYHHQPSVLSSTRTQPSDCSLTHCRNTAISISWNINIPRSLNSRDSFPRSKFENQAPANSSPGPILSPSTISFELHAKMAKEIDLEKCNFRNFTSSVTLTLDRVQIILVRISGQGLLIHPN